MHRAEELNDRAGELVDEGRLDEAEACYAAAIEADPDWPAPWFNLGLVHKLRRRWEDCVLANQAAVQLLERSGRSLEGDPACWNLGTAATAVSDWRLARRAWRSYGLDVPGGDDPPDGDFGLGFVRINPG